LVGRWLGEDFLLVGTASTPRTDRQVVLPLLRSAAHRLSVIDRPALGLHPVGRYGLWMKVSADAQLKGIIC
jgi:hypothetical protein